MDMSGGAPKTNIDGDISYKFDVDKGIFYNLSGTITNKMHICTKSLRNQLFPKLQLINGEEFMSEKIKAANVQH